MSIIIFFFFFKVNFISFFFFQYYIIIIFILYDLCLYFDDIKPATWDEFYEYNGIFTWYSGLKYFSFKLLPQFFFFLFLSKFILIIQIIIGIDLFILSFFVKKILSSENLFYCTFILVPWIYINLLKEKIRNGVSKKDIRIFISNIIFLNLWLNSKIVISNTLIWLKEWENWNKHTVHPYLKFYRFLNLTQKYAFNEMILMYGEKFTK